MLGLLVSSLAFVVLCGGLVVLSFSRRRVLLLCLYVFAFGLLTTVNDNSVPLLGGLKLYRALYPLLLLSVTFRFIREPAVCRRFRGWPNLSYLALVFSLIVCSFYSPYVNALGFADSGGLFPALVVVSLFWIAASQVQSLEELQSFALAVLAMSLSISLWVIWAASRANFMAFRGGTDLNENYGSLFVLGGAIPAIHFVFVCRRRLGKIASFGGLLMILMASSILASRGMVIAAALAALAMFAVVLRGGSGRRLVVSGVVFTLAVGIVLTLPGSGNLLQAFQGVDVMTLDDRMNLWGYALRYFVSSGGLRQFFGEGLSSGISVLGSAFPEYGNYHNTYLLWLMDRGIVGLIVFLAFLVCIGRMVLRTTHPCRGLMLGWFVYLLVAGLTATVSNEHLFWIVLGGIAGAASGWRVPSVRPENQTGMSGVATSPVAPLA